MWEQDPTITISSVLALLVGAGSAASDFNVSGRARPLHWSSYYIHSKALVVTARLQYMY